MGRMLIGLAVATLSCAPACRASTENAVGESDRPAQTDIAFEECWARVSAASRTTPFRGAIAIYQRGEGSQVAVLFSGDCLRDSRDASFDRSTDVLVSRIRDQENDSLNKEFTSDFDFVEHRIGASPEWPLHVFAVRGRLSNVRRLGSGRVAFDELTVVDRQRMPDQVYGQFLSYPSDRGGVVSYYLDFDFFDANGNKVIGPQ
jgi:hypothetical protein